MIILNMNKFYKVKKEDIDFDGFLKFWKGVYDIMKMIV